MNKSEITKKLILDSANELFYHQGYRNTGFIDIQNKTGISKGNITYHFKNKQKILEGIVSQRVERIKISFEEITNNSKSSKEALSNFLTSLLENSSEVKSFGCPMGTLISEVAKHDKELHKITAVMFQTYINWIEENLVRMGRKRKQASEVAASLLARVQGVALITHTLKDEKFFKKEIEKINLEVIGNI